VKIIKRIKFIPKTGCIFDHVSLYNGPSILYPEFGRYCSTNQPPSADVHTANNYLTILFETDQSIANSGWQLSWSADNSGCGNQIIHATNGQLSSPNFPSMYPNAANCFWTIYTEESSRVSLTFGESFELEGTSPSCSWDYITLHDGESVLSTQIGPRYCGTVSPGTIESYKDVLFVRFRTDTSVQKTGFSATWSSICGQIINSSGEVGEKGMIISPNYPALYPNNADCTWWLNGAETTDFVRLHFINFDLENPSGLNCVYDVVKVYKGSAEASGNLLGAYCGSTIPPR
jgi:cubilin